MVLSLVGWGSQKLIDDVAVGAVELNSVEACLFCQFYALFKLLFESFNVLEGHFFGGRELFIADISNGFFDCYGRGRPSLHIVVFEGVGYSSRVENLQEEEAAFGVNCIQDQLPAF